MFTVHGQIIQVLFVIKMFISFFNIQIEFLIIY